MIRNSLLAAAVVVGALATVGPAEAAMQCNAGFVKTGGNHNSIGCQHLQGYPSQAAAFAGAAYWKSKVGCNTGMYGPATINVAKAGPNWVGIVKFTCLGIT